MLARHQDILVRRLHEHCLGSTTHVCTSQVGVSQVGATQIGITQISITQVTLLKSALLKSALPASTRQICTPAGRDHIRYTAKKLAS